jgi:hypothetical protein
MIDHTGRNLYLILIPNSVTDQNDLTQTNQCYSISIRLLCGSTATCFDSVGSSSGNHYINMSLAIGLFTDMDPDR